MGAKEETNMKKTRLAVCFAIAALLLAGCSNKKAGQLPSGGKKVDITTEEGQKTVENAVTRLITSYQENEFTALGAKLELKGLNATLKGQLEGADLDVAVNKLQATVEAKLGDQQLEAHLKDLGGQITAKGTLPMEKPVTLDENLKFSKVGADVYLTNNALYADYSGKGLRTLLKDAGPIVSKFIGQPGVQLDLNELIDGVTGAKSRKIRIDLGEDVMKDITPTNIMKEVFGEMNPPKEEEWKSVFEVLELTDMVEFRTYKDGRFGVATNVTKEKVLDLAKKMEAEEEVAKDLAMFDKLNVKLAVVLNKDGLLSSASAAADVAVKIDNKAEDPEDAVVLDLAVKGEIFLDIKYNGDVKFAIPKQADLDKYELVDPSKIELFD